MRERKRHLVQQVARWCRFIVCVEDDSSIYENVRERGRVIAEGIDLEDESNCS